LGSWRGGGWWSLEGFKVEEGEGKGFRVGGSGIWVYLEGFRVGLCIRVRVEAHRDLERDLSVTGG